MKDLHDIGFKAIWMLDPGIKKEEGYFVYDSGSEKDVWTQTADGRPFVGKFLYAFKLYFYADSYSAKFILPLLGDAWPGPCVFPDFTQSKTRFWWSCLVKDFSKYGVDGLWNDMNEPAVFEVK